MVVLRLASRSPRRAELLRQAGIPFRPGPHPDVDETRPPGCDPAEAVLRIAERKARAAARLAPTECVLAADTLVFYDDVVLGKPRDAADATRMLSALSGRVHRVATGVAVVHEGRRRSDVRVTRVAFREIAEAEVRAYVESGEPLDKAGAYGIQGGAAAFVERLEGDVDTVIGLPVRLVRHLLGSLGLESGGGTGR